MRPLDHEAYNTIIYDLLKVQVSTIGPYTAEEARWINTKQG